MTNPKCVMYKTVGKRWFRCLPSRSGHTDACRAGKSLPHKKTARAGNVPVTQRMAERHTRDSKNQPFKLHLFSGVYGGS